MKKKFYIKDAIQKTLEGLPFYFTAYTTSTGNWTTHLSEALIFDSEQEAIWRMEALLREEPGLEFELITIFY